MSGRKSQKSFLSGRLLELAQKHWRLALKLRDWLQLHEESTHLMMAGLIGVAGGIINLVFTRTLRTLNGLFLGPGQDEIDFVRGLEWKWGLVIPVAGGLVAGLVLWWRDRFRNRRTLTNNLLEAVGTGDGRLSFRYAVQSSLASLVSLLSGASLGREGAITQLGAAFASSMGQRQAWPPYRLRLMVASGAAAGMAAAYNAPISGAVFAAQIVLGNFSMALLAPVLVSAVMASVISRSFLRVGPLFEVPEFEFSEMAQLPWFVVLGFVTGILGAGFLAYLQLTRQTFEKIAGPPSVRLAIGGLAVGAITLWFPEVIGNGYTITNELFSLGEAETIFLLGILCAKFLATGLSVGSGAVGGVFTPTLMLGATAGIIFSKLLHNMSLADSTHFAAFALAGMCGILAATTHSALLAIIMIFELSLNYSIMPALMVTCAVSTLVARRFFPYSVYAASTDLVGLEEKRESPRMGTAGEETVGDWVSHPVNVIRDNTRFKTIIKMFLSTPVEYLTVIDEDNQLVGEVRLQDLKEWLGGGSELEAVIAMDVMRVSTRFLTPEMRLSEALPILMTHPGNDVPVVNNATQKKLIGTLSRTDVLNLFSDWLSKQPRPETRLSRASKSRTGGSKGV